MIRVTTSQKLSIWLSLWCLASCQKPPTTTPPVSKAPTPTTITQPQQLQTATLVQIKNDWNGYSDITPIVRHYKLKPQNGNLTGNGHFAVGGYGAYNIRQQYTKKITIPAPIVQQFFRKLSDTKMIPMAQSATYQPIKSRSDDYPAITIQITTPQQEVTFFSSSQGKNYIPWQITTKQDIYISSSAAPTAALSILKPYIDHPGLEQLIHKRRIPPPSVKSQAKSKVKAKPQIKTTPPAKPSAVS